MHAHFACQVTTLAIVARRTRRYHVRPRVVAAARQRHDVVTSQELAATQMRAVTPAVLATIGITGEQEGVRHLPPEFAGDMYIPNQPNDRGTWHLPPFGSECPGIVYLENFRFLIQNQPQSPTYRQNREGLEGGVERQTTHGRNAILAERRRGQLRDPTH
jgi:hypothetical protein